MACSKGRLNLELGLIICLALGMVGCGRRDVVKHMPPTAVTHITSATVRPAPGGTYRVVKGDTLFGIAFRHGVDYRDLAQWNGIAAPYKIYVGRELRLAPAGSSPTPISSNTVMPSATTRTKPVATPKADVTPAPSPPSDIVADTVAAPTITPQQSPSLPPIVPVTPRETVMGGLAWRWPSKGAMISGFVAGDQTRQGVDIAGKAGDPVMAAADGSVVYSGNGLVGYGELIIIKHNDSFLSAYGHNRKRLLEEGQQVKAGQQIAEMGASSASRDMLHFEIRKNGKPINPLDYLPAR